MKNNKVTLIGLIVSQPVYDHSIKDEKFYRMILAIKRKSEYVDEIPIILSEKLIDLNEFYINKHVKINGSLRTYNITGTNKNKLKMQVLVREITNAIALDLLSYNEIILYGFICKKPNLRTTPSGKIICDVLLAVNRKYGKTDYIPCIFWREDATAASLLNVGDCIKIDGRIQSRVYLKRIDEEKEFRTAYEVCGDKFEIINEQEVE